ncbi:MAG: copper oxidase [Rhodobacterales bacterium RIFCSPHIGHO2_02_FULL_62_130]|nr:MAG: copper oxidase [Rhodobacterales bacterium RIFCSPHIGHO2_02_FULL_62_130]OHC58457.1 MAG: copper oxidase [Rhodobacterales bacterium RIFCSPHIGHO2_12_FULL_62_75]
MKTLSLIVASLVTAGAAFAAGTGNHSHDEMEVGQPGIAADVTRTITVRMYETEDGEYLYEPRDLAIAAGETIRFEIVNEGENPHEFVLDTMPKNAEHMELMAKFPEMEHDDPNAVRLEPGEKGSIIWTFSNAGTFEFACLMPGHYEAGMRSPVAVN